LEDKYFTLALAIIFQAVKDVNFSNSYCASEAKKWLAEIGVYWCRVMGIPEEIITEWKEKNFQLPPTTHRNWRY
jgi:hypothetical protein